MVPVLDWFAALANVAAGACLAIPALRASRHLLQLKAIQEPRREHEELERLRGKYVSAMKHLLTQWDALDHRLLWIGFVAFILGGAARLVGLWLSTGHPG